MISYSDITKLFSYDLQGKACIEIEFLVKGHPKYQSCWMGKTYDEKELYWFGLSPDGSEAYEYDNFWEFSYALVFEQKSLKDMWEKIEILSIDGCDPKERITEYLSD